MTEKGKAAIVACRDCQKAWVDAVFCTDEHCLYWAQAYRRTRKRQVESVEGGRDDA